MAITEDESLNVIPGVARGHPDFLVRGRLLDLDLLHVFVTVALSGGFTSAALAMHRTQAAVSLQIKRLENIVQAKLLQRSSHGTQLTDKGEIVFQQAQKILALNEELMLQIHSGVVAGPVRLGTFHHFAVEVLPPILVDFRKLYPDVWIEVSIGLAKTSPGKLGGNFDIVIDLEETTLDPGMILQTEAVSWYTSVDHNQHLCEPLSIAVLPDGGIFRKWAIDSLSRHGRSWRISHVCDNAAAIEAMVAAGLAVGIFKESSAREGVAMSRIRPIGPTENFPALPDVNVAIKTTTDFSSVATRKLRDFIIGRVKG